MKAVIIKKFGKPEVLQLVEIPTPKIKSDEILVKVCAAGINPLDWKIRKGYIPFLFLFKYPYILGSDIAGEVVDVGKNVTKFKIGDKIIAQLGIFGGGYAEYSAVPEKFAFYKPSNISFIEAATLPIPATTALLALKYKAQIKKDDRVLINGASGGVGIFALQLAKVFNAKVTGICSNRNIDFVKKIGADKVIDYTKENIYNVKNKYDIIFDTIGNLSFLKCLKILKSKGTFITTGFNPLYLLISLLTTIFLQKKYIPVFIMSDQKKLEFISKLVENTKIKPVIDRIYPLEQVAEAHKYSETHRARGKIVLTFSK